MDSPHRERHASSLDVRRIFVFLWNIIRKITLPPIFFWRGRIIGSLVFPCPVSQFRWSWLVKSLIVSESWCRGAPSSPMYLGTLFLVILADRLLPTPLVGLYKSSKNVSTTYRPSGMFSSSYSFTNPLYVTKILLPFCFNRCA
jgi:hypothetical protein